MASRGLMERGYDYIYDTCNGNELIINVIAGGIVANTCFWIFNLGFILLDAFQPAWAVPYKVQEEKRPTFGKYMSAMKLVLFNQIFVGSFACFVYYHLGRYTGVTYSKDLPSWMTVLCHVLFCIVIEEIGFYYSHRLFHHPRLYKYVHKIHHEWTAPVSITSIYCHPLEHFGSNLSPILLGATLCGSHITTVWIWAAIATLSTTFSHSGYHFPFQPSPEAHDYHHKVFNECFGVLGILDRLHNTSPTFLASVHSTRHRTSFNLKPIKQIYKSSKDE